MAREFAEHDFDPIIAAEDASIEAAAEDLRRPGGTVVPLRIDLAASKAFLLSFAEALRVELKDKGVRVAALMPGPTDTDFFERADMEDTKLGQSKKDDPRDVARDGFEALMAGKDHVIAGSRKNRLQVAAAQVTPSRVTATVQASMAKPGSGRG